MIPHLLLLFLIITGSCYEYTIIERKFENVHDTREYLTDLRSAWLKAELPNLQDSTDHYTMTILFRNVEDHDLYKLDHAEYDQSISGVHLHYPKAFSVTYSFVWIYQSSLIVPVSGYDQVAVEAYDAVYTIAPSHPGSPVDLQPNFNCKWNVTLLTQNNPVAKPLGLYDLVKEAFDREWEKQAKTLMEEIVSTTVRRKVNQRYSSDTMRILHLLPPFAITRRLTAVYSETDRLVMRYTNAVVDDAAAELQGQGDDFAHTHMYSYPSLLEVYNKLQTYTANMVFKHSDMPRDASFKLDSITFRQAVPDLLMRESNKNLSMVVTPLNGFEEVEVRISDQIITLKNMQFLFRVCYPDDQELLQAKFRMTIKVVPTLNVLAFSASLKARLINIGIKDVEVSSSRYETVSASGMKHILQSFMDEYLIPTYENSTLLDGIEIFSGDEILNQEKCTMKCEEEGIRTKIYHMRNQLTLVTLATN